MKYAILSCIALVWALCAWLAFDLYHIVHERKAMMEDYAEINRVNHELFNMQVWKEKSLDIVKKKIREFNFAEETYTMLDQQIQSYIREMHKLYLEQGELSDIIIKEVKRNGDMNAFTMKFVEQQVPILIKQLDLRREIPGFSDQIVQQIRSNEPLIKEYLRQELFRLVLDVEERRYADRRTAIYQKYGQTDLAQTDSFLHEEVTRLDSTTQRSILYLVVAMAFLISICTLAGKVIGFASMIATLSISSIILLVLGVSLPMIDIDARLNSFSLFLFGEPISFDEQVVYYQSKSIVEVTKTLWQGGTWDLKLVGVLVLLFSIVFPFCKLVLSAGYVLSTRIRDSFLAQNIIFHLGKWSMADVFVVAMFMAYIGFYGIISTQLGSIETNQGGFAVETVNYSRLAPGAFFFTAYTILSICISIAINRRKMTREAA